LADGLARARDVGVKVILRFVYNEDSSGNDTTLNRMIKHIEQIQSNGILVNNADVIAVVQAGFIGAWGEWHSSSNMHHESDLASCGKLLSHYGKAT
jgi:ABC-type phosphate/phosphonate transport system ATPase subunit